MARRTNGGGLWMIGTALALSAAAVLPAAASVRSAGARHAAYGFGGAHAIAMHRGHVRFAHAYAYGGLQCVPYARTASGIEIGGNAWTWWDQAAGVYERGAAPETGSVLTFQSNGRMRLGHVAVVTDVLGPREIAVDHANWSGHGGVNRQMTVVDVSDRNDWTAVRLQMGANGEFGSIYPTYGFIYDRPDRGTMVASAAHAAPAPELNPPPADLRGRVPSDDDEEVAELPEHGRHARFRHASSHHGRRIASAEHRRRG